MKNILIVLTLMILASCGSNGTLTYLKKGNGPTPSDSLIGSYLIAYETEAGVSMQEANPENPLFLQIDPNDTTDRGQLFETLKILKTGDSVRFPVKAGDLFGKSFGQPKPDSIAEDDNIIFTVSYLDLLTQDEVFGELAQKRYNQLRLEFASNQQLEEDGKVIDEYLERNGIDAITTDIGLRYVVTEEGDGPKAQLGQNANVHYVGKLMDGTVFDSSLEEVAKANELFNPSRTYAPLPFRIYYGGVINGWHEGLLQLNVGSKATLYIPSPLGYGGGSAGPLIKPNSILIFDVELVGID